MHVSRKFVLLALALCAALSFSGCGGSSKPISISITSSSSTLDGSDSVTLTATVSNDKNSAGVSWTVSSGGGTLSNQTTTSATYTAPAATSSQQSITITATSVAKSTQTGTVTITVPAAPAVTSTSASLSGAVGSVFSVKLQASGGIPPFTWALGSGTTLPTCLTLKSDGTLTTANGLAPNASCAGSYTNLTFKATDSGTPNPLSVTSAPLTVTITAPSLSFAPTLPAGAVGTAYSGSVAAMGVIGASTYTLASGSLPADLSLNASTGAITGTPKASDAGTFNFTVSVVDAYGDTATSGSLSIAVAAAPVITFGNPPMSTGTFGVAYSSAVSASGGAGALTYSLASGTLPPDLALTSSGAITGNPNKAADVGTFTFSAKASDAFGDSASSSNYTLVVSYPAVSVNAITPPTGYVGSVYTSTTLGATGGNGGPFTWGWVAASGSSLPPGLSLSTAGVITGTPTATGTYMAVATATDSATNSGNATLTITVNAGVSITTATGLPTGYVGSNYSQQVAATGGSGTGYTWSVSSGSSLPGGLTLSTTGLLSGKPSAAGTPSFNLTVTDSVGNTANATFSMTISPGVSVTAPALPNAYPGTVYSTAAFTASGGSGTGYTWSWAPASGSTLPNGLSINSSTGVVSGTPANTGTSSVASTLVVTATDSVGNTGSATVNISVEATLAITTPATLPAGTVGVAYSQSLAASGGSGTVSSWQVISSTLSSVGLSFSTTTGAITGATPTLGNASLTVTATDSEGHVSAQATFTVDINNLLKINQTTLPGDDVGSAYAQTLTASGGAGSGYTFSTDTAGTASLAAVNLSLSSSGAITGTPAAAGTATFTVTVTDSAHTTATQAFTIIVYGALSLPAPSSNTPGPGFVGISYSASNQISGTGGSSPGNLSISVVSGLPADGLSATSNGATLNITGSPVSNPPTPPYTVSFTVQLTDSGTNNSVTQNYSIYVATPTAPNLSPSGGSLPAGIVNQAYPGTTIDATGGVGPNFTWTVNGSAITNGTQVSVGDGLTVSTNGSNFLSVGGTPTSITTSGSPVSFTVQVKDDASGLSSGTNTYTIAVNSAQNLSGQVFLTNYCSSGSGSPTLPAFTITLKDSNGNTVQTQSSDSSGNYGFTAVPSGTYTIVPSYSGPTGSSSVFYPASQTVALSNGSQISGQNFDVALGYTVSGTYSYSGTTTAGQLYLVLSNNNCSGSGGNGTSIPYLSSSATSGNFTINGVAPGSYTLEALIDPKAPINLSEGQPNAADPSNGSGSAVTVSTYNVNSVAVALADPGTPSVGSGPLLKQISPQNSGAVIVFGGVGISSGAERYASYTLQWATTTTGFSSSNQDTFKATGSNGSDVWILRSGNNNLAGSLTNGTAYYFRAMGTNAGGNSPWQYWDSNTSCTTTTCAQTVTIGAPSEPNTVSGTITIPAGVTINSGAVLYAGVYDQSTNSVYADVISGPATGANSYMVSVPNGSNYQLFGILDQNSDGLIDMGDVTNVNRGNGTPIVVTGNLTGQNATLPSTNTSSAVQTIYQSTTSYSSGSAQTSTSYALNFKIEEANKLPVAVQLTGGPNVINPVDLGRCLKCGNVQFQDYFDISNDTPNLGDAYTFTVTYSDASTETVTAKVTGWDGGTSVVGSGGLGLPTNLAPSGTSSSDTPNFTWTYPASPSDFSYQFQLQSNTGCPYWHIPSDNSNSNGFTYAQTSGGSGTTGTITWGVDPTGDTSNNLSNGTTIAPSSTCNWSISASDSSGNQAQSSTYFTAP